MPRIVVFECDCVCVGECIVPIVKGVRIAIILTKCTNVCVHEIDSVARQQTSVLVFRLRERCVPMIVIVLLLVCVRARTIDTLLSV